MNIHKELNDAGVKLDHHQTDLYAEVTNASAEIISRYNFKHNVSTFHSAIPPYNLWYNIPFAFDHDNN